MRVELEGLAIFCGKPAFDAAIHVGRPNIGYTAQVIEVVSHILDRLWSANSG